MEIDINCITHTIKADVYQGSKEEVILVIHGYSSSKENQSHHAKALNQQTGAHIISIELSGHGNSSFSLSETRPAQHMLEVISAYDYIKSKYPNSNISASVFSYGGYLIVELVKYRKLDALVLRAPAIYPPEEFYQPWGIRLSDEDAYAKKMNAYRTDVQALTSNPVFAKSLNFNRALVVVHENDDMVPKPTTDCYITKLSADTFIATGFRHSLGDSLASGIEEEELKNYHKRIANWLNFK